MRNPSVHPPPDTGASPGPAGVAVAGYRIEALIGRGGMGAVYRAEEEALSREVALKVFDSRNIESGGAPFVRGGSNLSRFRSAAFDRRLRAAHRLSGEARLEAYRAIEADLMRDEAPMAPFMFQTDAVLLSTTTGCYADNPLGTDLTALCKKSGGGVG